MKITNILLMVVFVILILLVHNILKIFVLSKLKVNRWLVLSVSVIGIILGTYMSIMGQNIISYVCLFITAIFMLWFMDLRLDRKAKVSSKNNNVVIKSKPKPNRVKNISEEEKAKILVNSTKTKKKK